MRNIPNAIVWASTATSYTPHVCDLAASMVTYGVCTLGLTPGQPLIIFVVASRAIRWLNSHINYVRVGQIYLVCCSKVIILINEIMQYLTLLCNYMDFNSVYFLFSGSARILTAHLSLGVQLREVRDSFVQELMSKMTEFPGHFYQPLAGGPPRGSTTKLQFSQ